MFKNYTLHKQDGADAANRIITVLRSKHFKSERNDKIRIFKIIVKINTKNSERIKLYKKEYVDQRADSRSKKNYNFAACGMKTTFTER